MLLKSHNDYEFWILNASGKIYVFILFDTIKLNVCIVYISSL